MAYRRPKSLMDLFVLVKLKPDPKDNEPTVNPNLVGEPGVKLAK